VPRRPVPGDGDSRIPLRLHGLIERIPHTHRYSVTDFGLAR
jgi:hypothetical protein